MESSPSQHPSPWSSTESFFFEAHGGTFLTQDQCRRCAQASSLSFIEAETVIAREGEGQLEHVMFWMEGRAEQTWINDELPEPEKKILKPKDAFGAVSILLSDGVPRRSLKALTDCYVYTIPKATFKEICAINHDYQQSFTAYLSDAEHHLNLIHRADQHKKKSWEQHKTRDWEQARDQSSCGDLAKQDFVAVQLREPIELALAQMLQKKNDCLFVFNAQTLVGLCTYRTFCDRVILGSVHKDQPIETIMTTDLFTISATTPMLEGLMLMARRSIHHLPVLDEHQNLHGVISTRDMPQTQRDSGLQLLQRIGTSQHRDEFKHVRRESAVLVQQLHQDGFALEPVSRMIAQINDAVVERILQYSLEKMEEPPCDFAFVVFGSEGREEQTLSVDQDNGIIFEHSDQDLEARRSFFLRLGQDVCDQLHELGYPHCKGGIMAKTSACCLSHQEWRNRFKTWISKPNPEAILNSHIFFDMRSVFGHHGMVPQLMRHIQTELQASGDLFFHLSAQACLNTPVPLGLFQSFILDKSKQGPRTMDLKKVMNHWVECARLLALKHGIPCTHTLERFRQLYRKGVINKGHLRDVEHAYHNTLHLRYLIQEEDLQAGGQGVNTFDPRELGEMDQRVLKASLMLIHDCHRRLKRELCIPHLS